MFSLIPLIFKKRAERRVAPALQISLKYIDFEDDLPEEYFQEIADRSIEQFASSIALRQKGHGNGFQKEKRCGTLRSFLKHAEGISKLFKSFQKSHHPRDTADLNRFREDAELQLRIMKLYPDLVLSDDRDDNEEQSKRSQSLFGSCLTFCRKSRCYDKKSDSLSEGPKWPSNPTLEEIDRLVAGESLLNPSVEEIDRRMKKLNPNHVSLPYGLNVDEEATEDSLNCLSCFGKLRFRRKSDSLSEGPEWPSNPTLEEIDRLIAGESLLNPSVEEIDRRMKKLNPNHVSLPYGLNVDEEATEKDSLNCHSCFGNFRFWRKSDSLSEGPEWPSNPTLDEIDHLS